MVLVVGDCSFLGGICTTNCNTSCDNSIVPMYKLRPYQQRAINDIDDFITNSTAKNGLVVAPTGAGKSLYVSELARKYDRILCLQPSKELLQQNYAKYVAYPDVEPACIYSASLGSKNIGNVTFGTPKSVFNAVEDFKKHKFDYIVIDEAHYGAKKGTQIHKLVKQLNPKKVIGLTATPVYLSSFNGVATLKMMNRSMDSMFRKIIHVTQIQELVEQGFWSKLVYDNRHVDDSMLEYNSIGSDYTISSLVAMYEKNNTHENIINEVDYLQKEGRKSILIFVPSIHEANTLASCIRGAEAVSADTKPKERDRIVNGFTSGNIPVVINCNVLATGFDFPELSAIIHARATNSMAIWYQTVGRGVRIAKGKKDCKIVDFSGNSVKFGKVENLEFCELEHYGWGMFAKDRLLSGIPLMDELTTTKQDLVQRAVQEARLDRGTEFTFGKYKGKTIIEVYRTDPRYLMWVTSEKFEPFNAATRNLKKNAAEFIKSQLL